LSHESTITTTKIVAVIPSMVTSIAVPSDADP
jgi:hypothetical protein